MAALVLEGARNRPVNDRLSGRRRAPVPWKSPRSRAGLDEGCVDLGAWPEAVRRPFPPSQFLDHRVGQGSPKLGARRRVQPGSNSRRSRWGHRASGSLAVTADQSPRPSKSVISHRHRRHLAELPGANCSTHRCHAGVPFDGYEAARRHVPSPSSGLLPCSRTPHPDGIAR